MNRRQALKILGWTLAFVLIPTAFQSPPGVYLKPREIPGSGNLKDDELRKIRVREFLAGCARCHVCTINCPMRAIRVNEAFYPVLTHSTWNLCPSIKECAVCMEVCPPNALYHTYIYPGGFRLEDTPTYAKLATGASPPDVASKFPRIRG